MTLAFKTIFKLFKHPFVICMLVLISLSYFMTPTCGIGGGVRARTSEAKLKLASVHHHQIEFYKKNKRYTASLEKVEASFYPGGRGAHKCTSQPELLNLTKLMSLNQRSC